MKIHDFVILKKIPQLFIILHFLAPQAVFVDLQLPLPGWGLIVPTLGQGITEEGKNSLSFSAFSCNQGLKKEDRTFQNSKANWETAAAG